MSIQQAQKRIQLFRPQIREEAINAVGDVLRSGWLGLGPKTAEFEQAFAAYTGANYCVGVNSCTSALHLALRLLHLPPGSEVITTPLTFVSTNHAILYEGLQPVFADIEPLTGNLDAGDAARRITERTRAIVIVHYSGYPCDLDAFYALGRAHNVPIIEDCAHACGAVYRGKRIGSHGQYHAFSFHAVKNLPMGDGGALTLSQPEDDARARALRWLGIDRSTYQRSDAGRSYQWDYRIEEVGFKYHMNDIQAAIGLGQLPYLEEENRCRARLVARYREVLAGVPGVELLQQAADRQSSHHLYPILVDERERLIDKLNAGGVDVGMHYRRNDDYPMYERQDLPNVAAFTARVLSLPLHLGLTEDDVDYVSALIREGW
ncbi:MAG: DegT/DnrJ/EryC1/StrS family aminotransferase [Armatimonadota bacterium]